MSSQPIAHSFVYKVRPVSLFSKAQFPDSVNELGRLDTRHLGIYLWAYGSLDPSQSADWNWNWISKKRRKTEVLPSSGSLKDLILLSLRVTASLLYTPGAGNRDFHCVMKGFLFPDSVYKGEEKLVKGVQVLATTGELSADLAVLWESRLLSNFFHFCKRTPNQHSRGNTISAWGKHWTQCF